MLVSAGFLFVGLKTAAGAGQVKAWNMASNHEYLMEGHTVGAVGRVWAFLEVKLQAVAVCRGQGAVHNDGGFWRVARFWLPEEVLCPPACCWPAGHN